MKTREENNMNHKNHLKDKVECICLIFYIIGLVMTVIIKCPIFMLFTGLSIPFCTWKPIQKFLDKE
jgi:hypothetical protein